MLAFFPFEEALEGGGTGFFGSRHGVGYSSAGGAMSRVSMRCRTLALLLLALLGAGFAAADLAEIRSMIDEGKSAQALSELEELLAESPADPDALFLRGLILAEARQEVQALEQFEEVASLRPDRPEPLNNLAVVQAARGDYEAAVETLKEALRTNAAYRTAYENLTKIYGQLASEAYSRALRVGQAGSRDSVDLVLLSEMGPPEPADPDSSGMSIAAQTLDSPAAPLPEKKMPEELAGVTRRAIPPVTPPVTPDTAIAEALGDRRKQGRALGGGARTSREIKVAELADLVEAWALAWSEQRVDDYLYFYGRGFVPVGEFGRQAWEARRRQRIAAPEFIKVSVAFLDFEGRGSRGALVRFNQSYESNTFSDIVTKTLELAREDGIWKIVGETVDS